MWKNIILLEFSLLVSVSVLALIVCDDVVIIFYTGGMHIVYLLFSYIWLQYVNTTQVRIIYSKKLILKTFISLHA